MPLSALQRDVEDVRVIQRAHRPIFQFRKSSRVNAQAVQHADPVQQRGGVSGRDVAADRALVAIGVDVGEIRSMHPDLLAPSVDCPDRTRAPPAIAWRAPTVAWWRDRTPLRPQSARPAPVSTDISRRTAPTASAPAFCAARRARSVRFMLPAPAGSNACIDSSDSIQPSRCRCAFTSSRFSASRSSITRRF